MSDAPALEIVKLPGKRPFPPRVSRFTRPFWDALSQGRLVTTSCDDCGRISFPPRPLCRSCWSERLSWTPLSGRGTLYTFTKVHVVPRAFSAEAPYSIGIMDQEEGVRLLCRILGEVSERSIGLPIRMIVMAYEDGPIFAARVTNPSADDSSV